jgi:hypothetical protein
VTFISDDVIVEGRAMSFAETAEREKWAEETAVAEQAAADSLAAKDSARESAQAKLSGWGLTPDEITAIIPA